MTHLFWFFIWAWLFVGLSFLPQELGVQQEPNVDLPTWSVCFDLSAWVCMKPLSFKVVNGT